MVERTSFKSVVFLKTFAISQVPRQGGLGDRLLGFAPFPSEWFTPNNCEVFRLTIKSIFVVTV